MIKRITSSARIGALVGAGLAAIATVATLLTGPDTLASQDISLLQLLFVYLIGGTVGGSIVGVLLPFASRPAGAAITGVLVTAGVGSLLQVASHGFDPWSVDDVLKLMLFAVMLGVPSGLALREVFTDERNEPQD